MSRYGFLFQFHQSIDQIVVAGAFMRDHVQTGEGLPEVILHGLAGEDDMVDGIAAAGGLLVHTHVAVGEDRHLPTFADEEICRTRHDIINCTVFHSHAFDAKVFQCLFDIHFHI